MSAKLARLENRMSAVSKILSGLLTARGAEIDVFHAGEGRIHFFTTEPKGVMIIEEVIKAHARSLRVLQTVKYDPQEPGDEPGYLVITEPR